jgi:predicted KAP-like P-loop ATPase
MRLLSDNPATQDTLGFGQMATVLHTVIRETPYRPFTIGIFGEWGSGKSTLMNLIQTSLKSDGVKTVWFNAWKYDTKEVIWNALIQQIFYTMQNDPEIKIPTNAEKFKKDVAHAAENLAKYAAKGRHALHTRWYHKGRRCRGCARSATSAKRQRRPLRLHQPFRKHL